MIFNRGFSLVETLIASVVVVLSGLGTLKLYSYIEVARANTAFWMMAQTLANSQIAIFQRVNTENDSCNSSSVTFDNVESCILSLDDGSPFYLQTRVEKTLKISSTEPDFREEFAKIIIVRLSWNDRNGDQQWLERPVTVTKITNLLD